MIEKRVNSWFPLTACCLALAILALFPQEAKATGMAKLSNHPVCQHLGKSIQASSGAQMACFGPQFNGSGARAASVRAATGTTLFRASVNAADFSEDISPAGLRAYGQSETSIAAAGSYVVEAWNDSTGFFSSPCSPMNKDQLTGFAFSNDGGKTFTDLGGLPNSGCATSVTAGDPSVEVYQVGGKTYFYISSIFIPFTVPENDLSVSTCQVMGTGSSATLSCGDPQVMAISSQCNSAHSFCSFLDKEFLTLDPGRKRLYTSYTEFGINFSPPDNLTNGQIELAACDLTNPAAPVCSNGNAGSVSPPYFVVAPGDLSCEREGAYPGFSVGNGDVYVAHEFNWATNIFGGDGTCLSKPTHEELARVRFSCLPKPPAVSSCGPPSTAAKQNIVSMAAAFIPGYNRFPMNDFPRVGVSNGKGVVSIVWNDARTNPLGDILLRSYQLQTLTPVQGSPVKLNNDSGFGGHFLPALRYADSGKLDVSWFDRRLSPNSARTDVFAALSVDPTASTSPTSNARVTDASSDWNSASSDIIPNFGDYTDIYFNASSGLFVAWSDGRTNDPQPFNARKK